MSSERGIVEVSPYKDTSLASVFFTDLGSPCPRGQWAKESTLDGEENLTNQRRRT